jgi:hypothetical protein
MISTCVIFLALPKSIPIVPKLNISKMLQIGYNRDGHELVMTINSDAGSSLFENICSFWNTTKDIYYDKITLEYTSNMENYEKMIVAVYSIIVVKMMIVCVLFMVASATFSRSWIGNTIIVISISLLCASVGLNILELRTSTTFDNMIMMPFFNVDGYSIEKLNYENVTRNIFVDQEELLMLTTANLGAYFHFTKCEKHIDMDFYPVFDLIFVMATIVCLIVLGMMYVGKKYNPTTFDNAYQTNFAELDYYNQDYPKLGCFEPYSLIA